VCTEVDLPFPRLTRSLSKCIHLLNWFDHRNHICLVSELLGMCVYDFLKENEFAPFPRHHIQDFARQLFGSVACKSSHPRRPYWSLTLAPTVLHDLRLIHTDLKPENILLVNNDFNVVQVPIPGKVCDNAHQNLPCLKISQRNGASRPKKILRSTDIRLIDFGSATFESEYHSTVVCTRHYRAPEIILGALSTFVSVVRLFTMNARPRLVFPLRRVLARLHPGRVLHRACTIPNPRQPGTPRHDGAGHGPYARAICSQWRPFQARVLQRWG
jgi:serine/threonine protein kinase